MSARSRALAAAFVLSSLFLLGAAPVPDTVSYLDRAYRDGETLRFSLAWLRVVGGSAEMSIGTSGDSRLRISSVAWSGSVFAKIYPVHDEIESIVSKSHFSTVRYHKILNERSKSKEELTVVDESRRIAIRKGNEIAVPFPLYDPLSMIYHLRRLDLSPGKTHQFDVLADGKVYSLQAKVTGREVLNTDAGVFRTIVVEPKMERGGIFRDESNRLIIWYSDDERRIPVRIRSVIQRGSITATLRSVKLGSPEPPK